MASKPTRLTYDDVSRYAESARLADSNCDKINVSKGLWERLVKRWKVNPPSAETEKEITESASQVFIKCVSDRVVSVDSHYELSTRMQAMSLDKKPEEQDLIKKLEEQRVILDVACKSMETDLPLARVSLNSLLGWNKDYAAIAALNQWLGRTPHVSSLSLTRSRTSSMASTESAEVNMHLDSRARTSSTESALTMESDEKNWLDASCDLDDCDYPEEEAMVDERNDTLPPLPSSEPSSSSSTSSLADSSAETISQADASSTSAAAQERSRNARRKAARRAKLRDTKSGLVTNS